MKNFFCELFIVLFALFFIQCCSNNKAQESLAKKEITTDSTVILSEMEQVLETLFEKWYPLSLDTLHGGFFSDINYKWEIQGSQNKMIVTQARHVWTVSNTALSKPGYNKYKYAADHGVKFLKEIIWDDEYGGFYDMVSRNGEVLKENGEIIKRAYGQAFAIYALAAYYNLTKDTSALNLAIDTFNWLENYSYDPEYRGYFQFIQRNGTPFKNGYNDIPPKDQNSTIHLLEAFSELYKVWKDDLLKERLNSLLDLLKNKIVTQTGYMHLFFSADWTPFKYNNINEGQNNNNFEFDHVSFGHDIETAYLILEATESLGLDADTAILRITKKMVDHSITNGWDEINGGLFDRGYYLENDSVMIIRDTKEWWAQVETLNSLLIFHKLFPSDSINYYRKFCEQWEYCKKHLIDYNNGGWYLFGLDHPSASAKSPKGSIWKGGYHTSRSLINCIRNLD